MVTFVIYFSLYKKKWGTLMLKRVRDMIVFYKGETICDWVKGELCISVANIIDREMLGFLFMIKNI